MRILRFALASAVLALTPLLPVPEALRQAWANASGATFWAPPNYNFEAGALQVGSGPTNYDFSDDDTRWSTSGNVTYLGGVATLSGSVMLTSSS